MILPSIRSDGETPASTTKAFFSRWVPSSSSVQILVGRCSPDGSGSVSSVMSMMDTSGDSAAWTVGDAVIMTAVSKAAVRQAFR